MLFQPRNRTFLAPSSAFRFLTVVALFTSLLASSAAQTRPHVQYFKPGTTAAQKKAQIRALIAKSIRAHGPMNEVVPGQIRIKFTRSTAAYYAMARPRSLSLLVGGNGQAQSIAQLGFINRIAKTGWTLWQTPATTDTVQLAKALKSEAGVITAEPVHRVYPLLPTPNDADFNYIEMESDDSPYFLDFRDDPNPPFSFRRLWHLDDNDAFDGWQAGPNTWYTAATKPRNAPLIAVIDTGVDDGHGDFINAGGTGQDVTQGGQFFNNLSTQFYLGAPDPTGTIHDVDGHGTHVAGLALAAGNNGAYQGGGVIGTGYCANGMILRVFDDNGVGTDTDAAAAMFYAADNHADVVSLSLGDTAYSQLFQDATTYCVQSGSLVVAAGNENGNGGGDLGPIYPAACSGALAVTAAAPGGLSASDYYAGTGNYVDIAAPGGDIITDSSSYYIIQYVYSCACSYDCAILDLSNEGLEYPPYTMYYAYLAGTSMATPQVSGAAATYMAAYGMRQQDGYTNFQVYRALEKSAVGQDDAPYGAWDSSEGYGTLDIGNLVGNVDARGSAVGAIKGIVYDGGTPVSNVQVKAKATTGGIPFSTTTAADGTYRFESMPPGIYNVTAAPFGQAKTKQALVKAGCDQGGFDFWCGSYTGDDTPPTVGKFKILSAFGSSVVVQHWGYDVDTGIDSITMRIGTSRGANDIMADTPVIPDGNTVTFSGLTLPKNTPIWVEATYTNGGGLTTTVDAANYLTTLNGTITFGDYTGKALVPITIQLRNPGTTVVVDSTTVTPDATGHFSWNTLDVGHYDVAIKASHWLRKVTKNVTFAASIPASVSVTLINGDINGDNAVNLSDYNALVKAFRSNSTSPNWNPNADLNGDGTVSLPDYNILVKNFRKTGDP